MTLSRAKIAIADLSPPKEEVPGSIYVRTDVTIWSDLINLFKVVINTYGRLDILFANASVEFLIDGRWIVDENHRLESMQRRTPFQTFTAMMENWLNPTTNASM